MGTGGSALNGARGGNGGAIGPAFDGQRECGRAALGADAAPYGTNDATGFRNVLPAGEAGTDNIFQLAQFEADPTARPPVCTYPCYGVGKCTLGADDASARRALAPVPEDAGNNRAPAPAALARPARGSSETAAGPRTWRRC